MQVRTPKHLEEVALELGVTKHTISGLGEDIRNPIRLIEAARGFEGQAAHHYRDARAYRPDDILGAPSVRMLRDDAEIFTGQAEALRRLEKQIGMVDRFKSRKTVRKPSIYEAYLR